MSVWEREGLSVIATAYDLLAQSDAPEEQGQDSTDEAWEAVLARTEDGPDG